MRRPSGALLYQKTEIAHEIEPGRHEFRFERDLKDLELDEGRYPIELRVLASGSGPTELTDRLLVVDEDREPLPVSVVARLACSPSIDPSGRFVADPAAFTGSRDAASSLARLALERPGLALSPAIAPLTLDEWLRISEGYETVGPAGVETVPDDDPSALAYADSLETLREAAEGGVLEFLDVPFADPDMVGLQVMDGVEDLPEHYSRCARPGTPTWPSSKRTSSPCPSPTTASIMSSSASCWSIWHGPWRPWCRSRSTGSSSRSCPRTPSAPATRLRAPERVAWRRPR